MSGDIKVALITGSTSGIGLACAHVLAKRGVNLIVTGSRDASLVGDSLEELKRYGVRVDYVSADLSKVPNVEALWTEVLRLYPDGVDILINNAGVQHRCLVEEYAAEKWDLLIAINLTAPFHLTKNSLPFMKKKSLQFPNAHLKSSSEGMIAYLMTFLHCLFPGYDDSINGPPVASWKPGKIPAVVAVETAIS